MRTKANHDALAAVLMAASLALAIAPAARAQGAGAFDPAILADVTNARASAARVQISDDQLYDPAAMQRFAHAQNGVSLAVNFSHSSR